MSKSRSMTAMPPISTRTAPSDDLGSTSSSQERSWLRNLFQAAELEENDHVFDYGCGNARLANFMSTRLVNFTYYGLEMNTGHGRFHDENAKRWLGADPRITLGYLDDESAFQDALVSSNVVILGSVISHLGVDDAMVVFRRLKSVLHRCGRIVFSCMVAEENQVSKRRDVYEVPGSYAFIIHSRSLLQAIEREVGSVEKAPNRYRHRRYSHDFYVVRLTKEALVGGPPIN